MIRVSRRTVLTSTLMGGAAVLGAPYIGRRASAEEKALNIWAYDGFVTPSFKQKFEEQTGIRLNIKLVTDQGEQFNLMAAEAPNFSADIVCVAGHRFYQFIGAGYLEPIDEAALPGWSNIEAAYAGAEWVAKDGRKWGVPLMIASMGMLYQTAKVADATSWSPMFSKTHKGRVSYQLQDFFPVAMNYLGYDGSGVAYVGREHVAQKAVDATRDFLIQHKPLVRRFYDSGAEVEQMFVNDDIDLAQSWSGAASKLILEGLPVRYTIPKEGGWAFAYAFNITANSPRRQNAYGFLNALLKDPENGAEMSRKSGYVSAIKGVDALLSDKEKAALFLPPDEQARLTWVNVNTAEYIFGLIDKAAEEIRAA